MRRKKSIGIYPFLVTIPDRIYPFSVKIHGKKVRWQTAYNYALKQAMAKGGRGHYGVNLTVYRTICHVIGAFLFILTATLVSKYFFGSDVALYVLLIAATLAITFQEFYVHPRTYGQLRIKGIEDWLSWVVPFGVYVFSHFH